VLLALVGARLVQYDGDPTGFVQFGRIAAPAVGAPADARIESDIGYDGQFFYVQAVDPLLRERARSALVATDGEYRAQRMLYPALAYLAAAGRREGLPWTLLLLNVAAALAATAGAALFARARGRSGWWALAIGLSPGVVLAVLRDLSEPLAVAGLVAGLVAWRLRRPWVAGAALTAAVLAREVMLLGVIAIAIEAAWRRLAKRDKSVVAEALRACAVPGAIFLAWQLYLIERFDRVASSTTPRGQFGAPLQGLLDSADRALSDPALGSVVWDLAFLLLVLSAVVVAVLVLRRGLRAPAVAALCFAVLVALVDYGGDHWNYTRMAAPLMASLVVVGLDEERDGAALAVPAITACLTLLIPVAFSSGAGA
jgi:hypothetical protein